MDNILEIMRERHSVRTYLDKEISEDDVKKINEIIDDIKKKSGLDIKLVLNERRAFNTHYGTFTNAYNYIIMGGKKSDNLEELCGYYGEELVLRVQSIGLRSCWTVLTYNREEVRYDHELVTLICIGYGENDGFSHKMKEKSAITHNLNGTPDWFINGLDAVLLAPSAKNQQVIGFDYIGDNKVHAYISEDKPWVNIDMGIAKYHFEVGANPTKVEWN